MSADAPAAVLAVDLGKTGCRVRFHPGDGTAAVLGSGAGAPGLAETGGVEAALAAILAAVRGLPVAGRSRPGSVGVGAAGALAAPGAARALAGRLLGSLGADRVAVTSDAVTSHAGALEGRPGIVLAAGTGVVAVGLAAGGELQVVDGWGPWLGDEGGGAWIGLAGMRAALRDLDGRGPRTALRAAAEQRFGDLRRLAQLLGDARPAMTAAAFAPDVAGAAEAGDLVALTILDSAATALAAAVRAAATRLAGVDPDPDRDPDRDPDPDRDSVAAEPAPVALVGGLSELGRVLLEPFAGALAGAPRIRLQPAAGTSLDGAHLLATRSDLPHEAQVTRVSAAPGAERDRVAASGVRGAGIGSPPVGGSVKSTAAETDDLPTEAVRPGLADLDLRPTAELVRLLVDAEGDAHAAVVAAVPGLAVATEGVADRLLAGGRLFYVGAGTPGRLAMLDAAECVPTFGTPPELVVAVLAGGLAAMRQAVEGAEDDPAAGAEDLAAHGVSARDAVVGITASGRTPYVLGALRHARSVGALTVGIVNNPGSPVAAAAECAVELLTGAEVLAGSSRLTAGTAQKIALNALSTSAMIRLGKAYGPRMVDVKATNAKLRRRAVRIVRDVTGVSDSAAAAALSGADGHAKTAIVALLTGTDAARARIRLAASGGRVRDALAQPPDLAQPPEDGGS